MDLFNRSIVFLFMMMFFNLSAQEVVDFSEIYVQDDLNYKICDNHLFTGIAEKRRRNGHLVYQEDFVDGRLTKSTMYYNGRGKPMPAIEKFYYQKSLVLKTEIKYGFKNNTREYNYFNEAGEKILSEIYKNNILTYRCEFLNSKKNGKEFCLNEDGTKTSTEYINGKRIKSN